MGIFVAFCLLYAHDKVTQAYLLSYGCAILLLSSSAHFCIEIVT